MRAFYSDTLHSGGHELGNVSEDYLRGAYDTLKDLDSVNDCSFDEWIYTFMKSRDLVEKEPINTWGWIPIAERLPDNDWDVLISGITTDGTPFVCLGQYVPEQEIWFCAVPNCYRVDAWMEKPCAYRRENE